MAQLSHRLISHHQSLPDLLTPAPTAPTPADAMAGVRAGVPNPGMPGAPDADAAYPLPLSTPGPRQERRANVEVAPELTQQPTVSPGPKAGPKGVGVDPNQARLKAALQAGTPHPLPPPLPSCCAGLPWPSDSLLCAVALRCLRQS
jgi:hypothetical protein